MDNHNFNLTRTKQIDYKDVETLKRFLTTHARIQSKRKTLTSSRNQRKIAEAIKRARFMGFLPHTSR